MTDRDVDVLDDPVGESLRGRHAHLGRRLGRAVAYLPGVATFCAVPAAPEPRDWDDLARLLGPGGLADLFSSAVTPPPIWDPVFALEGRQMVWRGDGGSGQPHGAAAADLVELGTDNAPEMLDLVERAKPGPFRPRTPELGGYLGIRDDKGALVAMAGERLRPPGWTEISTVCTAPGSRGRGYAARLVTALVARVLARDERPFLHVAEANTGAIALYQRLGFETRAPVTFRGFRAP